MGAGSGRADDVAHSYAVIDVRGGLRVAGARYAAGTTWTNGRGQVYVSVPDHPRARRDGLVARSRLVAEEMLGRHLGAAERVWHVDGDVSNDEPENLKVFPSQAALAAHRAAIYAEDKARLEPIHGRWAALTPAQREYLEDRARQRETEEEVERAEAAEAARRARAAERAAAGHARKKGLDE